ncbi:hypothetical protein C8Q70DRAFT_1034520 [Cubamyces menziesii]|nr:hypothetical protein C8Q70DRAFT_1034520 [Cubamyces menziesii]
MRSDGALLWTMCHLFSAVWDFYSAWMHVNVYVLIAAHSPHHIDSESPPRFNAGDMRIWLLLSLSLFVAHSRGNHAFILRRTSSANTSLSSCTQGCVDDVSQSAHSPCPDPTYLACICINPPLSAAVRSCVSTSSSCGSRPDDQIAAEEEFTNTCENADIVASSAISIGDTQTLTTSVPTPSNATIILFSPFTSISYTAGTSSASSESSKLGSIAAVPSGNPSSSVAQSQKTSTLGTTSLGLPSTLPPNTSMESTTVNGGGSSSDTTETAITTLRQSPLESTSTAGSVARERTMIIALATSLGCAVVLALVAIWLWRRRRNGAHRTWNVVQIGARDDSHENGRHGHSIVNVFGDEVVGSCQHGNGLPTSEALHISASITLNSVPTWSGSTAATYSESPECPVDGAITADPSKALYTSSDHRSARHPSISSHARRGTTAIRSALGNSVNVSSQCWWDVRAIVGCPAVGARTWRETRCGFRYILCWL